MDEKRIHNQNVPGLVEGANNAADECIGEIHVDGCLV